jgi:outer membrane biosynthesis protein TonB
MRLLIHVQELLSSCVPGSSLSLSLSLCVCVLCVCAPASVHPCIRASVLNLHCNLCNLCLIRRASNAGKDLASGSLSGLKNKAAGSSDDAQNDGERHGNLLSSSISEGEPLSEGEPPERAPPKPAKKPPKPASEPAPPKPAKKPTTTAPKKPAPKPVSTPQLPSEAEQPSAASGPQMILHVAASTDDDAETREIKISAGCDSVVSVLAAVGAALGVDVTELSVWDGEFDEYVTFEESTLGDLADGAKIVANT